MKVNTYTYVYPSQRQRREREGTEEGLIILNLNQGVVFTQICGCISAVNGIVFYGNCLPVCGGVSSI